MILRTGNLKKDKMKKILYIITKSSWGGAQRYVYDLASEMKKEGYKVSVAFGRNEFATKNIFKEKLEKEEIEHIEFKALGRDISFFRDLKVLLEIFKIIKNKKADIVHLNSSKMLALGAPAARLAGAGKIVWTSHGLPFLEERPVCQKLAMKFIIWTSLLFVTDIIAVSKIDEKILRSWPLVKKKVKLIYNGIKTPSFLERKEARAALAARASLTLKDNAMLWGTIAELTDNKGILEFLNQEHEEIKRRNIFYFLIGTGGLKEKIEEKIRELGLEGHVFLLGFVPDAGRYMKAFDLFVLPSKKEGFPYVLVEAKMSNVKIRARQVGGVAELLKARKADLDFSTMLGKIIEIYEL